MTRFGVDWGRVTLTTVGAESHYEYRAVGETANTCGRIQELNKKLGTRILLSHPSIGNAQSEFLTRNLGSFLLRGKRHPSQIHELIDRRDNATQAQVDLCAQFEQIMESLQNADVTAARLRLQNVQNSFPSDGPTAFYLSFLVPGRSARERRGTSRLTVRHWRGHRSETSKLLRFARQSTTVELAVVVSQSCVSEKNICGASMGTDANSALWGSSSAFLRLVAVAVIVCAVLCSTRALAEETAPTCEPIVARVVSLQGTVEASRPPRKRRLDADPTRLDTPICSGDLLRTGATSRAALYVQSETIVRVDQHTTIALAQTVDETVIEFFEDQKRSADQLEFLRCRVFHFALPQEAERQVALSECSDRGYRISNGAPVRHYGTGGYRGCRSRPNSFIR